MNKVVGKVYLIGAGPGDPELITVKGLNLLRQADVVFYDRLINKRLLEEIGGHAVTIYVGKSPGSGKDKQANIATLMIDQASESKMVVRLKGGDPFVFGRGGEEIQALEMAGIPFEVVPGITSSIAVPAYAGIPLTHRDHSSSFTVISAIESQDKSASTINWAALAKTGGTLVVLMGWNVIDNVIESLISGGISPSTPAALIQWGTEPFQKTVTGSVQNIRSKGLKSMLGPPVVLVIGTVVALRNQIRWFDTKPLFGQRILITRQEHQPRTLDMLLRHEGALPINVPTISFIASQMSKELETTMRNLSMYQWIGFMSANAVEFFFYHMKSLGLDSRNLSGVKICCVGLKTNKSLENFGLLSDIVPENFGSKYLSNALRGKLVPGDRILIPRTNIAPTDFSEELGTLGAIVEQPITYQTGIPKNSRMMLRTTLENSAIDVITFTSSSTVKNFAELLNGDYSLIEKSLIAAIGPSTASTIEKVGLKVDIQASKHTIPGLISALTNHFQGRKT
jgi:uroporphyrinogen III methyltransferase/synthase